MLKETEKKVISLIQDDLPLHPRPFMLLAKEAGITEEEFIETVKDMVRRGLIRRFGATLRHQNAGFKYNAMVVWEVPEGEVERVGNLFASLNEVTHCYERVKTDKWPYNLYTMIHGPTKERCLSTAEKMAELSGIRHYQVLFSKREFKKTSMAYF